MTRILAFKKSPCFFFFNKQNFVSKSGKVFFFGWKELLASQSQPKRPLIKHRNKMATSGERKSQQQQRNFICFAHIHTLSQTWRKPPLPREKCQKRKKTTPTKFQITPPGDNKQKEDFSFQIQPQFGLYEKQKRYTYNTLDDVLATWWFIIIPQTPSLDLHTYTKYVRKKKC